MISCVACNKRILEEIDGSRWDQQPLSTSSKQRGIGSINTTEYIVDSGFVFCNSCAPKEFQEDTTYPQEDVLDELVTYFYEQNTMESLMYYENRGWSQETIEELRLGWAPPDDIYGAYEYLVEQGYSTADILSTGVFSQNEGSPPYPCLWRGRLIFPYYDETMTATYAIAREVGQDGHEADFIQGKYAKLPKNKAYSIYTDSIYGKHSLEQDLKYADEGTVVIAEGMPDAISAIDAGYPTLSPITSEFSYDQYDEVLEILEEYDFETVYLVPDNEEVQESQEERDTQLSVGLEGGLKTTAHLQERDLTANIRVVELPRPEDRRKIDLDDYLSENSEDDFRNLLTDAINPDEIGEYEEIREKVKEQIEYREKQSQYSDVNKTGSGNRSAIYDLKITDVLPNQFSQKGDRGPNPIQHIGDSRNYFSITTHRGDLIAHDFKRNVTYNPITYVLCELGERDLDDPHGELTKEETWLVWKWCKENNIIGTEDPIPSKAIAHIAETEISGYEPQTEEQKEGFVPYDVYINVLKHIKDKYNLEPGRDIPS